jgi:23S rRNA pseudouridine1911/1915/1917 synthase
MRKFTTVEADSGLRADVFLAGQYPQFSRSSLEALFDGKVMINGDTIKPSFKVKPGLTVSVDDRLLLKQPPIIELPVIYEDDNVIVINKPAGVLTHAKGALNTEATVASFIQPKLSKAMEGNRAGIVHRLDRQTSGVIIAAKTAEALIYLQKQFSNRKAKKEYIAIAEGELEPPAAIIDAPIARNPKKPQTFMVSPSGRPAQTEYGVLRLFQRGGKNFSLLQLIPHTGRTHQLRIHLAYINHPIVGDHVYGQTDGRMFLHAQSLEITLPGGRRQIFTAQLPPEFKDFESGE